MTEQVNHLASVWFRGDRESAEYIGERIDRKVESYAKGNLDHTTEAMTLLWELSREDENSCQSPKTERKSHPVCLPQRSDTPASSKNELRALLHPYRRPPRFVCLPVPSARR